MELCVYVRAYVCKRQQRIPQAQPVRTLSPWQLLGESRLIRGVYSRLIVVVCLWIEMKELVQHNPIHMHTYVKLNQCRPIKQAQ